MPSPKTWPLTGSPAPGQPAHTPSGAVRGVHCLAKSPQKNKMAPFFLSRPVMCMATAGSTQAQEWTSAALPTFSSEAKKSHRCCSGSADGDEASVASFLRIFFRLRVCVCVETSQSHKERAKRESLEKGGETR